MATAERTEALQNVDGDSDGPMRAHGVRASAPHRAGQQNCLFVWSTMRDDRHHVGPASPTLTAADGTVAVRFRARVAMSPAFTCHHHYVAVASPLHIL